MNFNTLRLICDEETMFSYALDIDSVLPGAERAIARDGAIEARVDGKQTALLGNVAVQLIDFARHKYEYHLRKADCSAFAYASLKGRMAPGNQSERYLFSHSSVITGGSEPPYISGGVLMTHEKDEFRAGIVSDIHFMVGATPEENEPLYASKIGTEYPAVLHTFEQQLAFYPAALVARIQDIEVRTDLR